MEKNLLSIMFAIEKFRPYLTGAKVIVHMDHMALCYLIRNKEVKARLMRWVEAVALHNNKVRSVVDFLKRHIFTRFGTPRTIIIDGGSHFCNEIFDTLFSKYGATDKVKTPYHLQESGQVEVFNHEIKNILSMVIENLLDWSKKLDDALWAYRKA
ncbi:uncharacterized protein [Nicotiana sylvestris]|uniref:uncharacterized protein n=1 Tax=Nicotiana sylvestris TaxID=4096 RepID=UPI00388C760B